MSEHQRLGRGMAVATSAALVAATVLACSASNDKPSTGTYTIDFPSTAAAIATDNVRILLFDLPADPTMRSSYCESLIQARKLNAVQTPTLQTPSVNVCALLAGKGPITVPYGETAALAIAQRLGTDFMLGCTIQTFGNGDAPLPIALSLVDVGNPVPDTTCATLGDFCNMLCKSQ